MYFSGIDMSVYFSEKIRFFVSYRANFRCEYCKIRELDSFLAFHIDHFISQKHGEGNEEANLIYSCPDCNTCKGTDLTTFIKNYQDIVPLFNPRTQDWKEHFQYEDGFIIPLSREAEATIKLLQLNNPDRIIQRRFLEKAGLWPN
jgi:hypothetical protein